MDPMTFIATQLAGNLAVIAQQGISNNQQVAHLTQLSFLSEQTDFSIPESFAAQGLERSSRPNDLAALTTSDRVPVVKAA